MIDINEVLRRAAEAGKMPPKPDSVMTGPFLETLRLATELLSRTDPVDLREGSSEAPLDLRQRPDGVWELPK